MLVSFIFIAQNDFAQTRIFLNPGLKFGYAFGEGGGFVFGAKLSVVTWQNDHSSLYIGAVISAEISDHFSIYHFGGEFGAAIGGFDIGPSIIKMKGESNLGIGTTIYSGFVLMPFFNYTRINSDYHISQIGSYLKFPLLVKGDKYGFF